MEFLTQQLFTVGAFTVELWHLLVAVAVLVLVVIMFVGICQPRKKKQKSVATQQPTDEQSSDSTDEQVDEVIVTIEEDVDTDDQVDDEQIDDEQADQADDDVSDVADQTETEQPAESSAPKKPTVKNYHISLRPDGKWQVKLSKGGKAIKLFRTQAEAIAFAKSRAKSQDGHITIHKVDGKIRKQKY